jgi:hypothetical protein
MANQRFDEFMLAMPNVNPRIDMGKPQMGINHPHKLMIPSTSDEMAKTEA